MEDESMKKIEELAAWLRKHCHKYQRFYTPSYMSSDINRSETVAGVRLNISTGWCYVDILGLTGEEEEQALEKLMEADDALKDDDEEDEG